MRSFTSFALLAVTACGAGAGSPNGTGEATPSTSSAPSDALLETTRGPSHHAELLAELKLPDGQVVRYYDDAGALFVSESGPPQARPLPLLDKVRPTELYGAVTGSPAPEALVQLQSRIEEADSQTGRMRWRPMESTEILAAVQAPSVRELWDASVCQWVTDDYNAWYTWGGWCYPYNIVTGTWHWGPWANGLYFQSPDDEPLVGAEICAITGPFDYSVNSVSVTLEGPGWWWRYAIQSSTCSQTWDQSLTADVTNAAGQVFNFYAFKADFCTY